MDCEDYENKKYTPLDYATKTGSLSNIILLKDYGANFNHVSAKGNAEVTMKTPLFQARNPLTTKLFLKYGADPTVRAFTHDKNSELTAVEHLMLKNPDCAKAVMDDCLNIDENDGNLIIGNSILKSINTVLDRSLSPLPLYEAKLP